MKSPFLSLTIGGILALIVGLIFIGRSFHHSGQNDEFLERGLLREGRVVSHEEPGADSDYAFRLMTNVSPEVTGADMQILEVEVKEGDFEKAPVGALVKLVLIPGDPPRARLAGSAKRTSHRFGYVYASLFFCIGLLLLWLAWHHKKSTLPESTSKAAKDETPDETLEAPDEKNPFTAASQPAPAKPLEKTPEPSPKIEEPEPEPPLLIAAVPDIMEKQAIKDPVLYNGAFEFSYSAEKTSVTLKNGTQVRVSQYRPISDLPKVLADKDLLHVLRTAESPWKLVDTIKTGQLALSHLLKEGHATEETDQFFVNGSYLGLLHRDEIDNGRWQSIVRGIWKITPLSQTISHLCSGNPDLAREAAFEILHHPDLSLIATLAPGLPSIRAALAYTPRTGEFADDRRFITRAADVIDALSQGNCYCQVYGQTSDPPYPLIEKKKFTLESGKKGDQKTEIRCTHCKKDYTLTEHAGSYVPYYVWEQKK